LAQAVCRHVWSPFALVSMATSVAAMSNSQCVLCALWLVCICLLAGCGDDAAVTIVPMKLENRGNRSQDSLGEDEIFFQGGLTEIDDQKPQDWEDMSGTTKLKPKDITSIVEPSKFQLKEGHAAYVRLEERDMFMNDDSKNFLILPKEFVNKLYATLSAVKDNGGQMESMELEYIFRVSNSNIRDFLDTAVWQLVSPFLCISALDLIPGAGIAKKAWKAKKDGSTIKAKDLAKKMADNAKTFAQDEAKNAAKSKAFEELGIESSSPVADFMGSAQICLEDIGSAGETLYWANFKVNVGDGHRVGCPGSLLLMQLLICVCVATNMGGFVF